MASNPIKRAREEHEDGKTTSDDFSSLQEGMAELWHQRELCDVVVVCGGRRFEAHKVVLAGASLYFRALFRGSWDNANPTISDMNPTTFDAVLHHIYEGGINTDLDPVDLLTAGGRLQVQSLVKLVATMVSKNILVDNVVDIWQIASIHMQPDLESLAIRYAKTHFMSLAWTASWTRAPLALVLAVLRGDMLATEGGESEVYVAVLVWLRAQEGICAQQKAEVLGAVRFPMLSKEKMTDVLREPLLSSCECKNLVIQSLAEHINGTPSVARIDPRALKVLATSSCALEYKEAQGNDEEDDEEDGHGLAALLDGSRKTFWRSRSGRTSGPTRVDQHWIDVARQGVELPVGSLGVYVAGTDDEPDGHNNYCPTKMVVRGSKSVSGGSWILINEVRLGADDTNEVQKGWYELLSSDMGAEMLRVRVEIVRNYENGIDSKVVALAAPAPGWGWPELGEKDDDEEEEEEEENH